MKKYKRFFEDSQSYIEQIKEDIVSEMKRGAILRKIYDWDFTFGRDVTKEGSILSWTTTSGYKYMGEIIQGMYKKENLDKLLKYTGDTEYRGLKEVAECIILYEMLLNSKLKKPINLYRVQKNDINNNIDYTKPISFTKIDLSNKENKAGTFRWKDDDFLVIIEQATKGLDISKYPSRDKNEQEVIIIGKYKIVNKEDNIIYLKEIR